MKITNRAIVKKENEFVIIEEIKNSMKVAKEIRKNYPELYQLYKIEPYVYKNISTNEFINIVDYQGSKFINTRNMTCLEFLESDFFKENRVDIIKTINNITYKKGPARYTYTSFTSPYDILESPEFLTSDFAKEHYEEIFSILDNIISKKEKNHESQEKIKKKIK